MHFQHFLRNKKAQETGGGDTTTLSLANILSFVLTGIVLLVFFFIFLGSSKSFASSGAVEQSGAETLDQFQIAFESVSNGSTDVAVTTVSISEDHVLAVFGPDADETLRDTCGYNNDMKKNLDFCRQPDDFCVCLYSTDTANNPLDCRTMPSGNYFNVYTEPYEYFTANFGEVDEKNNRADTVIYSDCWSSGTKLKVKKLAIEKDGIWISISDNVCGNSGLGGKCMHTCKGDNPIERKSLSRTCVNDKLVCCIAEEP